MSNKPNTTKTNTDRSGIYIVQEKNNPIATKIGVACSTDNNPDVLYQRRRALQQGNPRELCFAYFVEIGDQKSATEIEEKIFKEIENNKIDSLKNKTRIIGHQEWVQNIDVNYLFSIVDGVLKTNNINVNDPTVYTLVTVNSEKIYLRNVAMSEEKLFRLESMGFDL